MECGGWGGEEGRVGGGGEERSEEACSSPVLSSDLSINVMHAII